MVCQQVVGLTGSFSVTNILLHMHYLQDHYYYSWMGIAHMHYCPEVIKVCYLAEEEDNMIKFCLCAEWYRDNINVKLLIKKYGRRCCLGL